MQLIPPTELRATISPQPGHLWRLPIEAPAEDAGTDWPALPEVQAYVAGFFEVVPCTLDGEPAWLLVNEDAREQRLPPNRLATSIWHEHLRAEAIAATERGLTAFVPHAVLFGPALLWIGLLPPDA
jgi:hypothetical protein